MAKDLKNAGNSVVYVDSKGHVDTLGDIVVLAISNGAVSSVLDLYKDALKRKIIVDLTNPVNFETMDDVVVPKDISAAQIIAEIAKDSVVVKAFNINFGIWKSCRYYTPVVMVASDDVDAKATLKAALKGSGLNIVDAGSLKRARELEAMGFLQITLAIKEEIKWTGGFAVLK